MQDFDFGLGEDLDTLRATVAKFAAERIAPLAADIDRDNRFPRELWPELGDLGLLGITVEEDSAAPASAISRTWWRWKRSAAPPLRSVCPTARTRTCA